ncbi:hypothetical protein C8R44DRAFT_865887 [Mycena epipterygia]|nr:hypothetical protein C8R44DRAFT_865887 [Mycena epipterygia]
MPVLLCVPEYAPDTGHEDRWNHSSPFYAVVCDEWKGVVTSRTSFDLMKKRYPHARTWEAVPWSTFHRMWALDCTEYHFHDHDTPTKLKSSTTPDSSVLSLPSSLTDSMTSHHPFPRPSRSPTSATPPSHSPVPRGASSPPASLTKSNIAREELAFLAGFRPGPGPISPQQLNQQFARVLCPQAVVSSPTQLMREDSPGASFEMQGSTVCIAAQTVEATLRVGGRIRVKSKVPTPTELCEALHTPSRTPLVDREESKPRARAVDASANLSHMVYAVSGHNRIFQNRRRALAVFYGSPGTDLLCTRDDNEVFNFLAEDMNT